MPRKSISGFTLIEALVALVILSGVFTAVWSWFNSAVISSSKIEQAMAMPVVLDEFIAYLDTQPLQQQRSGTFQSGRYTVRWQASPAKQTANETFRRQPEWVIVLFDITVNIFDGDENIKTLHTQQLDYWPNENFVSLDPQGFQP